MEQSENIMDSQNLIQNDQNDLVQNSNTDYQNLILQDEQNLILQDEQNLILQDEQNLAQSNNLIQGVSQDKGDLSAIRLVTHSGRFHADEVSAVALLLSLFTNNGKDVTIVRTRDYSNFKEGDILIDVGFEYDPDNSKFDHHQKTFKDTWGSKYEVPLSSVGLIWRHYGNDIVSMYINRNPDNFDSVENYPEIVVEEIKNAIYDKLIMEIDAHDNGIVMDKKNFNLAELVSACNGDNTSDNVSQDAAFVEAVEMVGKIFEIKFKSIISSYFNFKKDLEYVKTLDLSGPYLLVKNDIATAFKCVVTLDPECKIKFIVFEDSEKGEFSIKTRRQVGNTFESICPLATEDSVKTLLGERYNEVIFIHKGRFIAKTRTLQSSIDIINLSLRNMEENLKSLKNIESIESTEGSESLESNKNVKCQNCDKNNYITNNPYFLGLEFCLVGLSFYGLYKYVSSD